MDYTEPDPETFEAEHENIELLPINTELTDSEKIDIIYQTILKIKGLVDSVTPEQVEKVASNPAMGMLMRMMNRG